MIKYLLYVALTLERSIPKDRFQERRNMTTDSVMLPPEAANTT